MIHAKIANQMFPGMSRKQVAAIYHAEDREASAMFKETERFLEEISKPNQRPTHSRIRGTRSARHITLEALYKFQCKRKEKR